MTAARPDFDVCGRLPDGMTLLEASAGTGKTFTIAALVARYVAEGVRIEQLLVVTFTKLATGELRERVRTRLVETEAGLRRVLAGGPAGDDPVLRLLASGPAAEVEVRRARIAEALAEFDAATIATTHGFCEHVLAGLGTAGDTALDTTFVADSGDLVDEVVEDLYLRKWYRRPSPTLTPRPAKEIGRAAVRNPEAPIVPALDADDALYHDQLTRARLARAVRREVAARKERQATRDYDDLLTRLVATLRSPGGAAAAARLRERYRVILVDEFQDTDPIQWDILRLAFGPTPTGASSTLILIGDPKQAIYSFRGADVWAYIDAARLATTRETLGVSWRSDQGVLDSLDAVFAGATLGHPDIAYRDVRAAPVLRRSLQHAFRPASMRVRVAAGPLAAPAARALVAADVAADIVNALSAGATLGEAPLRPGDIAVLVKTNDEAELVRAALGRTGVAAVTGGAGSVFAGPSARQWLVLLRALHAPTSGRLARAAALTGFIGWTPARIDAATKDDLAHLQGQLHAWSAVLDGDGVASLLETITADEGLPARLLARDGGERRLTDVRHIGQLLHAEAGRAQLGTSALMGWLARRIDLAADDATNEDRTLRLESDADAVQVITIHRCKGLEYPVVYVPFLWTASPAVWSNDPVVYHDPDDGRRTLDVGGNGGPDHVDHVAVSTAERAGEDLRLAYVALTRAQNQLVVWWAGYKDGNRSALARLLMRNADGSVADKLTSCPADDVIVDRLSKLAAASGGAIAVERFGASVPSMLHLAPELLPPLAIRRWDRHLDRTWRRESYSSITDLAHRRDHDAKVASEPTYADRADEAGPDADGPGPVSDHSGSGSGGADISGPGPVDVTAPAPPGSSAADLAGAALRAVASPMADLTGGAAFGTFVHAVLEAVDFTAPDLDTALAHAVRDVPFAPPRALDAAGLVRGLRAAIDTPLGAVTGHRALRAIPKADRLDELDFELPLAGGDEPTVALAVTAVASRLREWLPPDDPLFGYADRLDDPALSRKLHGYLAGSIDLVLRVPGDGGDRFVVIDYKTNRLGGWDELLTAWDYRPEALAAAMQDAHYPLQALIYTVALHRYLRWRLPDYDPERHLGGVAYLFLRGMSGPDTPIVDGAPVGVFAWTPPAGLIIDLSDLFDRGVATT
jgi:exodeoxyribonuclease V beta subunit